MRLGKGTALCVSLVGAGLLAGNMLFGGYVLDFKEYVVVAPVRVHTGAIHAGSDAAREVQVEPGTKCRRNRMIAKDWPPATYIQCNNGVEGWINDYVGFEAPGMPLTLWDFRGGLDQRTRILFTDGA